jgi:hypothetical protein
LGKAQLINLNKKILRLNYSTDKHNLKELKMVGCKSYKINKLKLVIMIIKKAFTINKLTSLTNTNQA